MKIVFFVHYFPPLNSTGARRVESLAKFLSRDGHEIVIVSTGKTLRDGPLTEPVPDYIRLFEINWRGQLVQTPREAASAGPTAGNAPKRIHWTRRVRQKLSRLFGQVLDHRVGFSFALRSPELDATVSRELSTADLFVSSFPPWPVHLAAMFAHRRFGKPWITDYRDQFSGNHVMNGSWLSDQLELWLDRLFLRRSTAVTVISGPMQTYYEAMHRDVSCVENGYDSEMFEKVRLALPVDTRESSAPPVIRYMGTVMRNGIPVNLLAAMDRLSRERAPDAMPRLECFGDGRLLEDILDTRYPHLRQWIVFLPAVPYVKSLEAMMTADALLFIVTSDMSSLSARGVLSTKLFEYLASRRQILAELDVETLSASYIRRASPEHVVSRDVDELTEALRNLGKARHVDSDEAFVDSLTRKQKAREFALIAMRVAQQQQEHN